MHSSGRGSGFSGGAGAQQQRSIGAAPVTAPRPAARIKQEPGLEPAAAWGAYGGACGASTMHEAPGSSPLPAAADLAELRRQQQQQRACQREQAEGRPEEDGEEDEGAEDEMDNGAADEGGGGEAPWEIPPGALIVESRTTVSNNSLFLAQAANAWFNNAPADTAWQAAILVDRHKVSGPFPVIAQPSTKSRWRLKLPTPEIKPHYGCRVRRFVMMKVGLIHIFLDSAPGRPIKPPAGKSPAKRPTPVKGASAPPPAGADAMPGAHRWSASDAAAAAGDGEGGEAAGGSGRWLGRTPLGHPRTHVEVSGDKCVTGMVIKDAVNPDRFEIGSMRMSKVFMDMQPQLKLHAHHAILYIRLVNCSPTAPPTAAPKIIECPEVRLGRSGQVWELKMLGGVLDPYRGKTVRFARWLDPQGDILRIEFEITGDPELWEEGGGAAAAGGERSEGGASAGGGDFGGRPVDGNDGHSRPGSPLRRQLSGGWAGSGGGGGGGGPPGGLRGGSGSWGDAGGSGSGRGFDKPPPGLPPTGPSGGRRHDLPILITASTTLLQLPEAALSAEVASLVRGAGVAGLQVAVRAASAGGAAVAGPAGSATGIEAWLAPTQKSRDASGRPLFSLASQALCSQVLQRHVGWVVEGVEATPKGGGLLGLKPLLILRLNPTPPPEAPGTIAAQHSVPPVPPPGPVQRQPSATAPAAPAAAAAPAYAAPQQQQQPTGAPLPVAIPVPPVVAPEAVQDVLTELLHVADALPQESASGLLPDWLDRIMAASSRASDVLLQGSTMPANQLINRYEMVRRMCQSTAKAAAGGGSLTAWMPRIVSAINNVAALEPPASHSGGGSGAPPSGGQHSGGAPPGDHAPIPSLQGGSGAPYAAGGAAASAHTGSSGQR